MSRVKVKYRYIAAALVVFTSIAITPVCIKAAYNLRGYKAFGGEYLIVPLGLIIVFVLLEIAKVLDHYRNEQTFHEAVEYDVSNQLESGE